MHAQQIPLFLHIMFSWTHGIQNPTEIPNK